ncbi:CD22-like protein [Mya arenaria]|uniref:CD22-like protein n=1 Tax=Mya arenaria TaxID=6604 RepID=A0ABY7EMK3_MYAAR|nr:CD22-like protein [Mya arenaria]
MRDFMSMEVVRWNVICLLLTIAVTQVDIKSVTLTPKTDLISVIENVPQIFRCVTSTCRPVATISWYLGSTQITSGNKSNSLQDVTTSTLNYTFQKRHQDKRILCRGSNGDGPSKPVCRFGGSALSSVVTLREDSEFRLNCTSDGNPLPSFSWIHPGGGQSTRLIINSIKRTHSGRYRIIAENRLIPLERQSVYLRQDMHLTVDVQFPPVVKPLTNVTVIEEGTVSVVCEITAGVPSKNDFQWERMSDIPPVVKPLTNVTVIEEGTVSVVCEITAGVPSKNDFQWERMSDSSKVSMEQTLIFANIDRKQTGYYKCTASNYMEPTRHDASVGISSNTVYIDVQSSDAKQLDFTITKVFVKTKAFTSVQHKTNIILKLISGAPRASALSQRDQNVTIAPGEPAAFTLKLVAFPRPRAKDFVWEKKFSASNDSAGSVIAVAVCGTLVAVAVVTVVVVILRRKYTVNCNFERKRDVTAAQSVSDTDNPENNAVHTYDELSVPNAASVNDALNDRGNGPDDPDLYTPLDESRSTNAVHYEDVNAKKEDVYYNMMLTNPL